MISFFRRIFSSKLGLFLTMCFVGLIAIAFASADISGTGTFGGVTGAGTAVEIGDSEISTSDVNMSVNNAFRSEQQENTGLDLKTFVEGGGFDGILERLINSFSIAEFGDKYGMAAGKRLVDSEIAGISAFQGADGRFSEENFRRALQQQGIKENQLRADFSRNLIADQLLPVSGFGAFVPQKLVLPYASLLLEARQGQVAIIPSAAFIENVKPSDAALSAFYSKNGSRYTIPERRMISYALFSRDRFNETIKPTEQEIQGKYNLDKAKYAASETRNIDQIIVPTQAAAKALADKIKGGAAITAVAESAGLAVSEVGSISKTALADAASQAVANAVFAAPSGGISAPAQSALGWHIAVVKDIKKVPAQTLEQVRPAIVAELSRDKIADAMAELTMKMEDEFASGATLEDVAKAEKLTIQATPMLLANGQNPKDPSYRPVPEMERILPLAFSLEEGADPQVVEIIPGQQYAIMAVNQIAEAAPPPLESIKQVVTRDYILDQGSKKAKTVADKIAKQVSSGVALSKALADTGVKLPAPESINSTRANLASQSQQGQVPPPLTLMFSMAEGTAKTLKAPQNQGWFVVSLTNIDPGDASKDSSLLQATRTQFKNVLGNEYTDQFINAMKADVGVKKNEKALNTLRKQLMGQQ